MRHLSVRVRSGSLGSRGRRARVRRGLLFLLGVVILLFEVAALAGAAWIVIRHVTQELSRVDISATLQYSPEARLEMGRMRDAGIETEWLREQ